MPGLPPTAPPLLFATFQMMFAVLTVALMAGAIADRARFGSFVVFTTVWSVVVYAPLAHWVFSPSGWMARLGVLDFAGGLVVEINCRAADLAVALVAGHRLGWPREVMPPHNLPLTTPGAGLLWFGWFGFNAGSAPGRRRPGRAGAAQHPLRRRRRAAGLGRAGADRTGAATSLGAVSRAVAGLVAITPACGFLDARPALLVGVLASVSAFFAVQFKHRLSYDDALDVVGVHYVGGVVGVLFLGFWASSSANGSVDAEELFLGDGLEQLGRQLLGGAATAFSFSASWLLATVIDRILPWRVIPEQEQAGIDQSLHAESAYALGAVRTMGRR